MIDLTDAACTGHDPALWFAEPTNPQPRAFALAICKGCPIVAACLDWALNMEGTTGRHSRWGILGGLTPAQRARMPRVAAPARAQCGSAA